MNCKLGHWKHNHESTFSIFNYQKKKKKTVIFIQGWKSINHIKVIETLVIIMEIYIKHVFAVKFWNDTSDFGLTRRTKKLKISLTK